MTVRFTPEAQRDIDDIFGFIEGQNPSAAQRVKAKLRQDAERLGAFPDLGHTTDIPGIRVLIDGRYPYLIFYTVDGEDVVVVRVRHAARRP